MTPANPAPALSGRALSLAMLALISLLLVGCTDRWRVGDDDPPNILLIIVDTLRADHLGLYGYHRDTSPNLDILAERSSVFERAYSHSPWTMPSVASILTGLEPREHGVSQWQDPLERQLVTISEVLQEHGYRTAAGVSHHILMPEYNYDQGFEVYNTSVLDQGSPHLIASSPSIAQFGLVQTRPRRREPWFVLLHFFDPHAEYLDHEGHHFGDEDMDRYDSEIAFTDAHLGTLFERMAERGQLEKTIVVLVADHGEEFRDHGRIMHTLTLYEEVIHIPLVVYVPGFEARRLDHVVAETQLAPTLFALAGLPVPPSFGAPAIPFDKGGFLQADDYQVHAETREKANKDAVIDGDWKLIRDNKRRRFQLFDLATDPGEKKNLRSKERARKGALASEIEAHAALPRTEVQTLVLGEETKEALRALGYLGPEGDQAPPQDPPDETEEVPAELDPDEAAAAVHQQRGAANTTTQ